MIRKVYEVDPMVCPECGGTMKVICFLTDYAVVDRIIDHLKLTFVAERPLGTLRPFLTVFDVLIYASSRWLEGTIFITRVARLAQLKRKLLFFNMV